MLPRIEEVFLLLRNVVLRLDRVAGAAVECGFGTATDNITVRAPLNATNEPTNLIPVTGRNSLTLLEHKNDPFFLCGSTARLVAANEDGGITLLGNTTRIRVTLI